MQVQGMTPILNVSNLEESFAWFAKLGWEKKWAWGEPPTFGCVMNGTCEIFLCLGAQGSRGGPLPQHAGDDEDTGGVWMTWWVLKKADVDAAWASAVEQGLIVTWPPTDETWGVREFHLRHPDGHTFRVSCGVECE